MMKKLYSMLLFFCFALLTACNQTGSSTNLQELKDRDWSTIVEEANGSEVRLYMWGGDEGINEYIDDWLQPRLQEEFNMTLERVPMNTEEILQKLQTEKQADKQTGTIDIIWLNGENFKNAKDHELLAGSFTDQLPNFNKYYDNEDPAITTDFGTEVEGMEAPWGKVQFVFHYDRAKIDHPPQSFDELQQWIENNPQEFTYPAANDFTGNAFLRHLLYAKAEKPSAIYAQPFDQKQVSEAGDPMWTYLQSIQSDLWRSGEHYPNRLEELDQLYGEGEVSMTMGYNEARAESLIEEGVFPETTESFVMEPGSIGNTHFLSIPYNSPNKAGALVAINDMLSPEAQLEKLKPEVWGESSPINFDELSKSQKEQFESVDRGNSVLDQQELEETFLPEAEAEYVDWIEEEWMNELVQN
ncbi:ABC transporter substrate-binding protein [Halobacillus andaensis]|uniref:ABC transporter substrate-binding protein n=1 Tax=Halobacillus andaensis TaxID=1176239 RepID=A0A917EZD2_HALAA|nr:ABC transporter substrate-binding protein [Halobacillus andaensis]MBP2006223.1 putative spermidine/putrescine transport system substrate-binding protein [Halobacillus andaensis]GGF33385.1 ABC transporter substrate-binding protein [Halobacillus andaensis]